jgi:aspartyl-tRNA(Asn)/glutamyl-tRNA(Gln) amidotransferase subunit A
MYMEDMLSVLANLAGVPSVATPAGKSKSGLPIGVQLIGPRQSDQVLLNIAKNVEEAA